MHEILKLIFIGKTSSVELNNNGDSIFSSTFKVLKQIITALEDTSTTGVSTADFTDALNTALSCIKNQEVLLANANSIVTNMADRLDSLINAVQSRVSDIETGDTNTQAAKLTAQETEFEITENTLAGILKMPRLSDYL